MHVLNYLDDWLIFAQSRDTPASHIDKLLRHFDPRQEGSAISDERLGVTPEPGVVEPSCVAASGISEELSALHSRVLDTLSEARAPSTRRLYALKWGVFVK